MLIDNKHLRLLDFYFKVDNYEFFLKELKNYNQYGVIYIVMNGLKIKFLEMFLYVIWCVILYSKYFKIKLFKNKIKNKSLKKIMKRFKSFQVNILFCLEYICSLSKYQWLCGIVIVGLFLILVCLLNNLFNYILGVPLGMREIMETDYGTYTQTYGTGTYEKCDYYGLSIGLFLIISTLLFNSKYMNLASKKVRKLRNKI